jgi:hypothetical protein
MTFDELKSLAEGEGFRYFVAPDRTALMMSFGGLNGSYQVLAALEVDGRFLQFRTLGYRFCPEDNPHLEAVLRLLGTLDYQLRLTKFGWDPSDGEIVGYADIWVEDAPLTKTQFRTMLGCFLPGIDLNYPRITATIETGTDPGEVKPNIPSGLPEALRRALEGLGDGKPEEPEKKPEPVGPAVI